METVRKFLNVAFVGLAVLTGCQKAEQELEEPLPTEEEATGTYTLTIQANKGAETRALYLEGTSLNAYWNSGEKVYIFKGDSYIDYLDVTPGTGEHPLDATLSRAITVSGLAQNDNLTLLIPRETWSYTGQDGTLETIGSTFDYALASVQVDEVDTQNQTITTKGDADFANQQSIYRFGFKVGGTGDAIPVKGITVISSNNALVQTCGIDGSATASGSIDVNIAGTTYPTEVYASLRNSLVSTENPNDNTTVDTYSFNVIGDDNALYLGEKAIPGKVMNKHGRFISASSVSVTKSVMPASNTATNVVW